MELMIRSSILDRRSPVSLVQLKGDDNWSVASTSDLQFDTEPCGRKTRLGNDQVSPLDHFSIPRVAEPGSISERFLPKLRITVAKGVLNLGTMHVSQVRRQAL